MKIPALLTPGAPAIRAAQLKQNLANMREWDEPMASVALASWSEEETLRLQSASRMQWLPLEYDIILAERLFESFGQEGLDKLCGSLMDTTKTNILRPIFQGGAALFGMNGRSVLRVVSPVVNILLQHCGTVEKGTSTGKDYGELILRGIPPLLQNSQVYLRALALALEFIMREFSVNAKVVTQLEGDSCIFKATW